MSQDANFSLHLKVVVPDSKLISLDAEIERASSYISAIHHERDTHNWSHCCCEGASEENLAWLLAHLIVKLRCSETPYYQAWKNKADHNSEHSTEAASALRAFLGPVFGAPNAEPHIDHLEGAIAEYLWYFVSLEAEHTEPHVFIEPPKFNTTDKGGDGFVLHRDEGSGELMFRLWELKKKTGTRSLSTTISEASRQIEENGARYIAEYTAIGQKVDDLAIVEFCKQLYRHWHHATPQAAAGIAVATSDGEVTNQSFSGLGVTRLETFATPNRLRGFLATTTDFATFATKVKGYIWKGL